MNRWSRTLAALVVTVAVGACAPVRAETPPVLGVASIATLTDRTSQGYDVENDAIRGVGATWIRTVMNWNEIEVAPGVFDWGRIDAAVTSARAHGLSILALLSGPAPAWENPGAPPASAPPADPAHFATFAATATQRYSRSVSHWEIWNEPNLPQFWSTPDPSRYTATLSAAFRSIRRVQPTATVVVGGLSTGPGGVGVAAFARGIYAAGGGKSLSAIGIHPYTYPYPLDADPRGHSAAIGALRSVMVDNGQSDKTMWVTEWGQSTGTGATSVTPERQADIIVDGVRYLRRQPGIGPVFLFTSKDWSPDPSVSELNFGLYHFDWSPKPVVARLRAS
ncbi:cellulase family glycosylhydrolase [uncultured Williamsia sp.]|uniref:cellulase family glycosylhydrolase n=1 Tax=uncultured Williamsia sp. TaxID=259311 RepID=UPI00261DD09E|nr:cellulase family glycosylhydrolase [uncultured Williamsia sp.]